MANVFLTQDAYAKMKAAKLEGESFSDVVMREVKQNIDLDEYLGCCKELDAKKVYAQIKKERVR